MQMTLGSRDTAESQGFNWDHQFGYSGVGLVVRAHTQKTTDDEWRKIVDAVKIRLSGVLLTLLASEICR